MTNELAVPAGEPLPAARPRPSGPVAPQLGWDMLSTFADLVSYAGVISESGIVPGPYRGEPGDIIVAVQMGAAIGLRSPIESLYRIHVIDGRPCLAAELIASLVNLAGHDVQSVTSEAEAWAEVTITRRDSGRVMTVRRDMEWARRMRLADRSNYRSQPATMLYWRALAACARFTCPEVLFGMQSVEELTDAQWADRGAEPRRVTAPGEGDAAAAAALARAEGMTPAETRAGELPAPAAASREQLARIRSGFTAAGFNPDATSPGYAAERAAYVSEVLGHAVENLRQLTASEADSVIAALEETAEYLASGDATAVDAAAGEDAPEAENG